MDLCLTEPQLFAFALEYAYEMIYFFLEYAAMIVENPETGEPMPISFQYVDAAKVYCMTETQG